MRKYTQRIALTLIELTVVVGIVLVLLAITVPAIQHAREASNRTTCKARLRQIGVALHGYHDRVGHFPSGYISLIGMTEARHEIADTRVASLDLDATVAILDRGTWIWGVSPAQMTMPGWSCLAQILDYFEPALARRIDFALAVDATNGHDLRVHEVPDYTCPSDRHMGKFTVFTEWDWPLGEAATTSFALCFGANGHVGEHPGTSNGVFYRNSRTKLTDIRDGAANTLAIGERASLFAQTPWAGAFSQGSVRTTPGAPVYLSVVEEAPVQILAHVGSHPLNDPLSDLYDFFSPHGNQVNFLLADGSVRALATHTDVDVLQDMAVRAADLVAGN